MSLIFVFTINASREPLVDEAVELEQERKSARQSIRTTSFQKLVKTGRQFKPKEPSLMQFRHLLLALHRNAVYNETLPDEEEYRRDRRKHSDRKDLLRLRLINSVAEYRTKDIVETNTKACQRTLLLQRFQPAMCRESVRRLVNNLYHSTRQRSQSFGVQDIDSFIIIHFRKALKYEVKAAGLQFQVAEKLIDTMKGDQSLQRRLNAAKEHYKEISWLCDRFDELYRRTIKQTWDVDTIDELCRLQRAKASIVSLLIDSNNTIFVGYREGKVSIFASSKAMGSQLKKEDSFSLHQNIAFKGQEIRGMTLGEDSKKLIVAYHDPKEDHCWFRLMSIDARMKKQKNKIHYKGNVRVELPPGMATSIMIYDRYIVVTDVEGNAHLFQLGAATPLTTYRSYQPINTAIVCNIEPLLPLNMERSVSDMLICGLANGSLSATVLPMKGGSFKAIDNPTRADIPCCGPLQIWSLVMAWNYIYAGCADGSISVCAIWMENSDLLFTQPIRCLNIQKLTAIQVHGGPVMSILFCGGSLFSFSHDFSTIHFEKPDRIGVRDPADFRQSIGRGRVFHSAPVSCAFANEFAIVSGDEEGTLVVTAPQSTRETFQDAGKSEYDVIEKVRFSFLEYDFGECFQPTKGVSIAEETYLTITNCHHREVTLRCIMKKNKVFHVHADEQQMKCEGCTLLESKDYGSMKKAVVVPPQKSIQYRVFFTPRELDKVYSFLIDFIIDEKVPVRINFTGSGANPAISSMDNRILDFNSLEIGHSVTKTLNLYNSSRKDVFVNLQAPSVSQEIGDTRKPSQLNEDQILQTFAGRGITIEPPCFIIPKLTSFPVNITFKPREVLTVADLPLKFNICNASYTVAIIKTRSHRIMQQDDNSTDAGDAASSITGDGESSKSVVSVGDVATQNALEEYRGLRVLTDNETILAGPLIRTLLANVGWNLNASENRMCLVHQPSGLFLDIPHPRLDLDALVKDSSVMVVDTMCVASFFYELTYYGVVLKKGRGFQEEKATPVQIEVSLDDLNEALKDPASTSGCVDGKGMRNIYGMQTLTLNIYSFKMLQDATDVSVSSYAKFDGTDGVTGTIGTEKVVRDKLYCVSHINFMRGFAVLPMPPDDIKSMTTAKEKERAELEKKGKKCKFEYEIDEEIPRYRLVPKLDVVGIHRIETNYGQGTVKMFERFDRLIKSENRNSRVAEVFRPTFIAVKASVQASFIKITDHVWFYDSTSGEKIEDTKGTSSKTYVKQYFKATGKEDMILLPDPVVPVDHHPLLEAERHLVVEIGREEPDYKKINTVDVKIKDCKLFPHSVKYISEEELSRCAEVHPRPPVNLGNASLPFSVHSAIHSVGISMKLNETRQEIPENTEFTNLQCQIRNGFVEEFESSSFFDGAWVFVVDGVVPKLVAADPKLRDSYSPANSPRSTAFRELGVSSRCPIFELHFMLKGLVIRKTVCDDSFDAFLGGKSFENVKYVDLKLEARKIQYFNTRYGSLPPASLAQNNLRFVNEMYKITTHSRTLCQIQDAFRKLADRIDIDVAAMRTKYGMVSKREREKREDASGNWRLFEKAYFLLHEMSMDYCVRVKAIDKSFSGAFTNRSLHVPKLVKFLAENALKPEFDVPLSPGDISLVVKTLPCSPEFGTVSLDDFINWCEHVPYKRDLDQLNERTVLPRLLDEEIKQILQWTVHKNISSNEDDDDSADPTAAAIAASRTAAALRAAANGSKLTGSSNSSFFSARMKSLSAKSRVLHDEAFLRRRVAFLRHKASAADYRNVMASVCLQQSLRVKGAQSASASLRGATATLKGGNQSTGKDAPPRDDNEEDDLLYANTLITRKAEANAPNDVPANLRKRMQMTANHKLEVIRVRNERNRMSMIGSEMENDLEEVQRLLQEAEEEENQKNDEAAVEGEDGEGAVGEEGDKTPSPKKGLGLGTRFNLNIDTGARSETGESAIRSPSHLSKTVSFSLGNKSTGVPAKSDDLGSIADHYPDNTDKEVSLKDEKEMKPKRSILFGIPFRKGGTKEESKTGSDKGSSSSVSSLSSGNNQKQGSVQSSGSGKVKGTSLTITSICIV